MRAGCSRRCGVPSDARESRRLPPRYAGLCVLARPLEPGPRRPKSREAVFHREFREDLRFWVDTERRVAMRALDLVEAILRDPFTGIGKPEPLKYLAPGTWSR